MGIKSDKTFEEIVERIVALFKPQPQDAAAGNDTRADVHISSSASVELDSSIAAHTPDIASPSDGDSNT